MNETAVSSLTSSSIRISWNVTETEMLHGYALMLPQSVTHWRNVGHDDVKSVVDKPDLTRGASECRALQVAGW